MKHKTLGLIFGCLIGAVFAFAQPVGDDPDHFVRYLQLDSDEDGTVSWVYNMDGDPTAAAGTAGDVVFDVTSEDPGKQLWLNSSGGVNDWEVAHFAYADADAYTIASTGDGNPATLTLTPRYYRYIELFCQDTDTCDITMGETNVIEGMRVIIANVGSNICDFADTAGVSELNGAFAMDTNDTLSLIYAGDRWVELIRSDN